MSEKTSYIIQDHPQLRKRCRLLWLKTCDGGRQLAVAIRPPVYSSWSERCHIWAPPLKPQSCIISGPISRWCRERRNHHCWLCRSECSWSEASELLEEGREEKARVFPCFQRSFSFFRRPPMTWEKYCEVLSHLTRLHIKRHQCKNTRQTGKSFFRELSFSSIFFFYKIVFRNGVITRI